MPTKKKTTKRRTAKSTAGSTADVLRARWQEALKALAAAEAELEKQWKTLVKKSGLSGKDAKGALQPPTLRPA